MKSPPQYADLHLIPENQRIKFMGETVVNHDKVIGFIVESETKANRYIKKLMMGFPDLIVKNRFNDAPQKGLITVKICRKDHKE